MEKKGRHAIYSYIFSTGIVHRSIISFAAIVVAAGRSRRRRKEEKITYSRKEWVVWHCNVNDHEYFESVGTCKVVQDSLNFFEESFITSHLDKRRLSMVIIPRVCGNPSSADCLATVSQCNSHKNKFNNACRTKTLLTTPLSLSLPFSHSLPLSRVMTLKCTRISMSTKQ